MNIISFDVPFPANYGGVIDVFYKLKYLHKKGITIHLHCFEYGRGKQKELEKYCESITYYKRKIGLISLLGSTPYIVKSRISNELKRNLLKNNFPILFEGLHSCFLLDDVDLKNRFKIFRESNIEHEYYAHLALAEKNIFRKKYYRNEAKKLKHFESIIKNANIGCVVSLTDLTYFQNKYPDNKFVFVPSFHSGEKVEIKIDKGDYVLYHGNLSVAENNNAAEFIINNVFKELTIPLIIAGLKPSHDLENLIKQYPHITLIKNPNEIKMKQLIENAQINFLYTEQATGLKLKLINVLYNGRHCIVNSKMVVGTTLNQICLVEDNIEKLKKLIINKFSTEISTEETESRNQLLLKEYSNENSYRKLIENIIF